jgi:hypothetical protein
MYGNGRIQIKNVHIVKFWVITRHNLNTLTNVSEMWKFMSTAVPAYCFTLTTHHAWQGDNIFLMSACEVYFSHDSEDLHCDLLAYSIV